MIPTTIWTSKKTVHKEKDFMIKNMIGYNTVGCQCFKDCTCAEDNKTNNANIFRVFGKNKYDKILRPYDFNTIEEALNRIKQLKSKL